MKVHKKTDAYISIVALIMWHFALNRNQLNE